MTMTPVEAPPAFDPSIYDPDEVGLRGSPIPQARKLKLSPTLSPSPEDPDSDDSSSPPESPKTQNAGLRRKKPAPSQSDGVLIQSMGGGKAPDVARTAVEVMLASGSDDEEMGEGKAENLGRPSHLAALAAGALQVFAPSDMSQTAVEVGKSLPIPNGMEAMAPMNPLPPIKVEALHDALRHLPPRLQSVNGNGGGNHNHELAPIQGLSPKSEKGSGGFTLPSISAQLGNISDFKHPSDTNGSNADLGPNSLSRPSFSQSPPQPPLFQIREPVQAASHGSPPISPNDTRRELPSPGRVLVSANHPFYYSNNPRRASQPLEAPPYAHSAADYSSSATETPSTDQSGSTPGGIPAGLDRMSIDEITNPPVGGFQCTYPGCNAQPFQTQYLLNSHANVHSSNRPHYCPVKGCPRSEGGKGFKRKNEMIRHGLVHESPGYVCPYCVDREHKYPRPDNLQRHVRVHHVDKDKDDPELRDVLAQRPEGPSRGRRRRGGTT